MNNNKYISYAQSEIVAHNNLNAQLYYSDSIVSVGK